MFWTGTDWRRGSCAPSGQASMDRLIVSLACLFRWTSLSHTRPSSAVGSLPRGCDNCSRHDEPECQNRQSARRVLVLLDSLQAAPTDVPPVMRTREVDGSHRLVRACEGFPEVPRENPNRRPTGRTSRPSASADRSAAANALLQGRRDPARPPRSLHSPWG